MSPHASQFAESALDRLKKGFRPATWLQYRRMFAQFIAFLEYENTHVLQVNTIVLLAFMEFCYQSGLSQANISNHLSAIRAMFIVYGLNTKPFQDERVPLYIKSLKINANFKPTMTKLVSIDMLQQIVSLCDQKQFPIVFKALYLFCFFSFMRLSNVLPHSVVVYWFRVCKAYLCTRNYLGFTRKLGVVYYFHFWLGSPLHCVCLLYE